MACNQDSIFKEFKVSLKWQKKGKKRKLAHIKQLLEKKEEENIC